MSDTSPGFRPESMSKFEFPNRPGTDRPNPFQDEDGKNPFGDAQPASPEKQEPAAANPYAADEHQTTIQPYLPEDYETFLPHRGKLVFWLGLSSCLIQAASVVIAAIAVLLVDEFVSGFAYGAPAQLFGLALSLPAWILGHGDLKAIRAGAMNQDGEGATKRGLWLGVGASLLGGGQLTVLLVLIIYSQFYA